MNLKYSSLPFLLLLIALLAGVFLADNRARSQANIVVVHTITAPVSNNGMAINETSTLDANLP